MCFVVASGTGTEFITGIFVISPAAFGFTFAVIIYSILPPGAISAVSAKSAVVSVISEFIVEDVPAPFNTGVFIVQFTNAEPFVESSNVVFIADN